MSFYVVLRACIPIILNITSGFGVALTGHLSVKDFSVAENFGPVSTMKGLPSKQMQKKNTTGGYKTLNILISTSIL